MIVRRGGIGIKFDGASVFLLRSQPVPVIGLQNEGQNFVAFSQVGIDFQRAERGSPCLWEYYIGINGAVLTRHRNALCKLGMRQRIVWIQLDCLARIHDAAPKSFGASLLAPSPGSYIQLVCLEILGAALGETTFVLSGQLQPEFLRNLAGNFVLHCKQLVEVSIVLVSPNFLTVCRIQQINMQAQFIYAVPDPS